MSHHGVIDWLLEDNQPAIRHLTLTRLLERPMNEPDVIESQRMFTKRGWAADILAKQNRGGWWVSDEALYRPKYVVTNWMLLVLADLGLTRKEPRIKRSTELWIRRFAKPDGGFGSDQAEKSHLCVTGNTTRALVQFGYAEHPKVRSAFDWLVKEQKEDGGWHCFGGKSGVLDSWEGLSAFAVYPRQKWSRAMKRSVDKGAEFYLKRNLHRQGARYGPWFRFHYPVHYYYDLLVGLDILTALGYGGDARLNTALRLLKEKRRVDGRWKLDAVHPDLEGSYAGWYKDRSPTPLSFERVGQSSKMITYRALLVLKRAEGER